MTDLRAEHLAVVALDARALADQLRSPATLKSARQAAREVLWRAAGLLEATAERTPDGPEAEASEEGAAPTEIADADVLQLLLELQAQRRALGDRLSGLRPVGEVWVRTPMPERLQEPLCAARTLRLASAVGRRFTAVLALDAVRLDWFDKRCSEPDPTRVAKVRPPDTESSSRLDGSELELLVKTGRSRFS